MMRDWILNETRVEGEEMDLRFDAPAKIADLQRAVETVIRGKADTVKFALVSLFAKGHLLIEDVPGIGKTTLSNALARALDLSIHRIQFTSDLLPSDVIGLSIFDQQNSDFIWKPGPIFSNVVIADEINRATPKTQSALLEAMAEEQVTVEGISRRPAAAFYGRRDAEPVRTSRHLPAARIATRPLYDAAAYGLPEPGRRAKDVVRPGRDQSARSCSSGNDAARTCLSCKRWPRMCGLIRRSSITCLRSSPQLDHSENLELGVSPRGSLALYRSAQALAMIEGRDYCIADDIKRLVLPCFAHRIIINSRSAGLKNKTREAEQILNEILQKVAVPI